MSETRGAARARSIPAGVIVLGVVSLLMDLSSETIHSVLPLFLVGGLGASVLSVGVIEGIAEATASLTKVFSGVLSDRIGRRKPLLLLGYGLAALTKPLFALATGAGVVLLARFVDRIGKGVRGAPRDALIADLTPPASRGAAYGLRQTMDTVGAFGGPLIAMLVMFLSGGSFRLVFWVAVIPALLCVAVIAFGVREPAAVVTAARSTGSPIRSAEAARLGRRFWEIAAFSAILALARFSDAFLILRVQGDGLSAGLAPLAMVVMNVLYALSSYPLGMLADRVDRRGLLVLGVGLLILADLVLARAGTVWLALVGAGIWGLQMGATQGVISAMMADAAAPELRGTAFGVANLLNGAGLLIASVAAGALWSSFGPAATFWAGAACAAVALAGLSAVLPREGAAS